MTGPKTNERPGTRAQVKNVRMSATKARAVLDLVRGLPVDEAAAVLADNLRVQPVAGRTFAVCAMLQDKPVEEVARLLAPLVHEWFVAGLTGARGMTGETLAERLRAAGVNVPVRLHDNVAAAWRAAVASAQPDDRVLGFGSFHTVGDILATLQREAGDDRDGK